MMRTLIIALALLAAGSAYAGEGWQGRPSACDMPEGPRLERCREWVRTVQRPDIPQSCCGESDVYIADNFEQINGELWMEITADYPEIAGTQNDDGSITPPAFQPKRGMKIKIPPEKLNSLPEDANRSGHGVIYMRWNGEVLCAFLPPLT